MKNTFKTWISNGDIIKLIIIDLIFLTILFIGLFYSDVPRSIINLEFDRNDFGSLMGFILGNCFASLLVVLCSIFITRHLIKSWIKFRRSGTWL